MRFWAIPLILWAAIVAADPQPGTPGNSGNGNPHGSPPGQGGAVPGNSGSTNPHGTPPGQRIGGGSGAPGAPASLGSVAGSGSGSGQIFEPLDTHVPRLPGQQDDL